MRMKKKGLLTVTCTIAIAFAVIGASQNADARSGLPACSSTISACGCVITSPGNYAVSADLTAGSSSADCIDIKARNVNLNTMGYTISGPGAVGINILNSARNANVQFSPASDLGNYTVVSGFDTGIQVAGANAVLYNFESDSNSGDGMVFTKGAKGSHASDFGSQNNGGNGITINGASNLVLDDFSADSNATGGIVMTKGNANVFEDFDADDTSGGNGITVTSSKSSSFTDFDADNEFEDGVDVVKSNSDTFRDFDTSDEGADGVEIANSKTIAIASFSADGSTMSGVLVSSSSNIKVVDFLSYGANDNGIYGVQLQNTKNSLVSYGKAVGDAQTGIYVGCAVKNGPTASGCSNIGPSNSNRVNGITAGYDYDNSTAENYGVVVDLGDSNNLLTGLVIGGSTTTDAIDENSGCDNNAWFNIAATTVSPSSCITASLPVASADKGAFSGRVSGHTSSGN